MKLAVLFSGRVGSRLIAAVLQAAILIVLARELEPALFGVFAASYSLGLLGTSVLGFGATTRILRLRSNDADRTLSASLLILRFAGAVIGATMGFLVAIWEPMALAAVAMGCIFSFTDAIVDFAQAAFAGVENHVLSAALPVTQRLTQFIAAFATGSASLQATFTAVSITSVTLAVVSMVLLMSTVIKIAPAAFYSLGSVLRSSAGYWFAGIVPNLKQIEPIVVLSVGSAALAGQFSIVSRLANPLLIVPATLQVIFVPRLASLHREGSPTSRTIRQLWVISGFYAGALVILSPMLALLLPLLLGPEYGGIFALTAAVVAAAGLSSLSYVFQIMYLAQGQPWKSSAWIATYSIVGIGLYAAISGLDDGSLIWTIPLLTQLMLLSTLALRWRHHSEPRIS